MKHEFEAIYQDGVLRPLEPIELSEMQKVTVNIQEIDDPAKPIGAEIPAPETEDDDPEPVWRGVFPGKREQEILFTKEMNVAEDQLPQRPFRVDMDWYRVTEDDE